MKQANGAYVIQPVMRSLRVLEAIAVARGGLTLKQVAADADLPKTTAFKHLYTLRTAGFVVFDAERDRFRLGAKTLVLSGRENRFNQLRELAAPSLDELNRAFNETVNLAVLEGSNIIYISVRESRYTLRAHSREGGRDAAMLTALGRAILAAMPRAMLTELMEAAAREPNGLEQPELDRIHADIVETRRRGHALDEGEAEKGVICVGAAVRDAGGVPIAGVSISAPQSRFDEGKRLEAVAAVGRAADEIAAAVAGVV